MSVPDDAEIVFFLFGACEDTLDAAFGKLLRASRAYPSASLQVVVDDAPDGEVLQAVRRLVPRAQWGGPRRAFNLAALTKSWAGKAVAVVRGDMYWGSKPPSPEDGGGFVWFLDTDELYVTGCCFPSANAFGEAPFIVPYAKDVRGLRRLPRLTGNVPTAKTALGRLVAVWEDGTEYERYRERVVSNRVSAAAAEITKNKTGVAVRLQAFARVLAGRRLAVSGWDGAAFELAFPGKEAA